MNNQVILLVLSYVTVIFIDVWLVMYFHNKYGYIHYFKDALYRQLTYIVIVNTFLYIILPDTYVSKYYQLTLVLAILQYLLYFQIVFEGIKNLKIQAGATIIAVLTIFLANYTGDLFFLKVVLILISCFAMFMYLRHYDFLAYESLTVFILIWGAFGFNEYFYKYSYEYFYLYWLIIVFLSWITQSFLSTLHLKINSNLTNLNLKNIQINKNEILDKILEVAPVSLILTDHTSKILYVNRSVERITGYSADELINQKTRIFQSGETPLDVYKDMWQTIRGGKQWNGTLRNKRKNGSLYWENVSIIPIVNTNNIITNYLGVKFDSSQAMVERSALENNAYFDDLTGTLRRKRFNELMNDMMQHRRNGPFYIVMIDLNKFKQVNDQYGHAMGDAVLVKIVDVIKDVYPSQNALLSRLGGDEFVFFVHGLSKAEVYSCAKTIQDKVKNINRDPMFKNIDVSASVGVAKVTSGLDHALKKADHNMYSHKRIGKKEA